MIITIDGPAASGKSTTAREVAQRLGLDYLDTGALYRTLTYAAQQAGVEPQEGAALDGLLHGIHLKYRYRKGEVQIRLAGKDVTEAIRSAEVTAGASAYSALPSLRRYMVAYQRKLARGRSLVAEGRDMGSVVFPEAELKIFLRADARARAERRAGDFREQGREVDVETVQRELERRDELDSTREHSPLVMPEDAVVLDTTQLSIEEQVAEVLRLAESRWPKPRVDPDELVYPGGPGEPQRRHGMRWPFFLAWSFVRIMVRLLFGTRYHNEERCINTGPLLVASNHIAWLDPPAMGAGVKREISFVAKKELFGIPLFGQLIAYFNAIPIQRGTFDRGCFDIICQRLAAGGTVLFFPEGTRKPVGRLGRAKFGLGLVAYETGAPVLPIYVKGTTRWFKALFRRDRINVYLGRPLHIAPLLGRGIEGRELYDLFGEGVMAEIARLQAEAGGAF